MDDDQDRSAMRNQMVAIVLMTAALFAWFTWFMPARPPQNAAPKGETQQAQPSEQQKGPLRPFDQTVGLATPMSAEAGEPGQAAPASAQAAPASAQAAPASAQAAPASAQAEGIRLPQVAAPASGQTEPESAQADEFTIENEYLRLVFTRVGARLKQAYILLNQHGMYEEIRLVPQESAAPGTPNPQKAAPLPDAETVYPLGLRFTNEAIGDAFDVRRFEVSRNEGENSLDFTLTVPGFATIRKTFTLMPQAYLVQAKVDYENLEDRSVVVGQDNVPAYILNWGPAIAFPDLQIGLPETLVWRKGESNETLATAKLKPSSTGGPFFKTVLDPAWLAVKSAYFLVGMKAEDAPSSLGWILGDPKRFRFGIAIPRFELASQATQSNRFLLYMGPKQMDYLKSAWPTLPTVYRFFDSVDFMDWFAKLLLRILNGFYSVIPNYGLGIIFITVLVRMAMFPLTLKQMRSMKKMQMLAPELEEIKAKCEGNQQELQRKMMELYRERGVNPMGGCLPMVIQLPVFIALYRMLWAAFELRGAPFPLIRFGDYVWIRDLSQADHLIALPWMAQVPVLGQYVHDLNLLPILGAVAMVLSTKLMPMQGPVQNPQQKMIMNIMPVFFSVMCYKFASGLNLYILVSTVLGILQSKLVRVGDVDVSTKKPPRKKQHFYTAARLRRKRLEKQMKQDERKAASTRTTTAKGNPKDPSQK